MTHTWRNSGRRQTMEKILSRNLRGAGLCGDRSSWPLRWWLLRPSVGLPRSTVSSRNALLQRLQLCPPSPPSTPSPTQRDSHLDSAVGWADGKGWLDFTSQTQATVTDKIKHWFNSIHGKKVSKYFSFHTRHFMVSELFCVLAMLLFLVGLELFLLKLPCWQNISTVRCSILTRLKSV